jgi:hypothetical protein
MGLFTSKVIEQKTYYQPDQVKAHWFEKNGQRHGEYKEYHPNCVLKYHCYYDNDSLTGRSITYYSNSKIYHDIQYKNGYIDGYSKEFDENEQLIEYVVHQRSYESNCLLVLTATYKDSVLQTYEVATCKKQSGQNCTYVNRICVYDISRNVINAKIIDPIQLFQNRFRRKLCRKQFNTVILFVTTKVLVHLILSYL